MAKPIINDLKVECRDRFSASEHGYGSVMWNDGMFRYHFWTGFDVIKPSEERQRSTGRRVPRIYKNPIVDPEDRRRHETRYLDADSATWRPVVAEIVKRIADQGLVEKAKQAKLDEIAREDAEREEAIRRAKEAKVFGTHGQKLYHLLNRACACMMAASVDDRRGEESKAFWSTEHANATKLLADCDVAISLKDE